MNTQLLHTFLCEDGDAYVRQKLLDTIRKQRTVGTPLVWEFDFNRFSVTVDFETKQVSIRDDLTVGPEGECKVDLGEFEQTLQEAK